MTYLQLTQDERYMMGPLRRQSVGPSAMARFVGRDRSTIWRELKRNIVVTPTGPPYCVSKAKEQRNDRLRRSRLGCQHSSEDYALVRRLLLEQWRPEPIAGALPSPMPRRTSLIASRQVYGDIDGLECRS